MPRWKGLCWANVDKFSKILLDALPDMLAGLLTAAVLALLAYGKTILNWMISGPPTPQPPPRVTSTHQSSEAAASPSASIGQLHRIPAGPAIIGSGLHEREAPPRQVFVTEFEIAEIHVTVSQYLAFLVAGGMNDRIWWSGSGWEWRQGKASGWGRVDRSQPDDWTSQKHHPYLPVVGVTWYEAEAYCKWLGAEKNCRVRLPTEEEWEKGARGEDGRLWPWGEEFSSRRANTYEHGVERLVDAGSLIADKSPFGLMDMSGNAQDWTSSSYTSLVGEEFPSTELRIARGGSWNDTAFGARASFRHVYPPGYYFPFLSFRVVVERF